MTVFLLYVAALVAVAVPLAWNRLIEWQARVDATREREAARAERRGVGA